MKKSETFRVPRNPLFGVTDAFTAKIIWRSSDKKTVAVVRLNKGRSRRNYTGRRDVYLLTLPVLPKGRTGGEGGDKQK